MAEMTFWPCHGSDNNTMAPHWSGRIHSGKGLLSTSQEQVKVRHGSSGRSGYIAQPAGLLWGQGLPALTVCPWMVALSQPWQQAVHGRQ
jgi:hypothetical protein